MVNRRGVIGLLAAVAICSSAHAQALKPTGHVPTPSEVLGFEVGADRKLADYKQISSYFKALAAASPRVQIEILGKTTLGEEMFMAVISTPENLANKAKYKEIAHKLADPRGLSPQQIDQLAHDGKTILLITCNIHSTEIGSSQMAMEWAHKLATTDDPEYLRRLNDSIVLLVPSLNPDGETMVTEWYRKYLGTKYEGGSMPYLYHHYVGHDDNRDWFMLTQIETKNVNHMVYHDWFPQFWLDEHQMGDTGPRIYIPPNADPVAKLVNPLVHRGNNLMGADMGWRLEEAGKSGVIYGYSFDAYWPGGTRNTGWWKNMYGVLTEVASARIATPVDITPDELQGGTKGLITYEQQINFPNPWPGGTWRLRDIMDYELIVSSAALETVSKFRQELLHGVASMATQAVQTADPQVCWRIPMEDQRDPVAAARLVALLLEHGVEVRINSDAKIFLVPTAQPYGRFVDEMMGVQRYPEVRPAPNSGILEPYDVAAWSLPLMMGVKAERMTIRPDQLNSSRILKEVQWPKGGPSNPNGKYFSVAAHENNIFALTNAMKAAGGQVYLSQKPNETPEFIFAAHSQLAENAEKFHVQVVPRPDIPQGATQLKPVRLGIYKSYLGPIDEGWTRFLLDQYGFKYKSIDNKEMRGGNLNNSYDAILLPDMGREGILEGRETRFGSSEEVPPEYAGGIGKEGVRALREFVDKGGTVITLANASDVLIGEDFGLPIRNSLASASTAPRRADASAADFNIPGSLLRVYLDTNHPVAAGMPHEIAAFVDSPIAFQTSPPPPDVQRSVIAWYPDDAKDILVSGYAHGAERLQRKAAAVAFQRGKGKVVMFGFRVQHRAQMEGTFQLLFNAIEWAGM